MNKPVCVLAAVFGLLAAGCTTTGGRPPVSGADAARFNVQLGVSYLQRDNLIDAREKLERAVQQDPSYSGAHAALGLLYERVGEISKAGTHLRRATQLAPDDADLLNNYGGFLCRQGDPHEGMRHFERAAGNAFYRTPEVALTNAGVCARGIPDAALADAYFRRALDVNRNYPDALLQMADIKLAAGEAFNARAFIQRYEAVSPATPQSLDLGRRIELEAGDPVAVDHYIRRLRQEFPESAATRRLEND